MKRRGINMAGMLLLAMAATDTASAQTNYPNNSVRVISDSGAGGGVDIALRIIASGMSRYWNRQVVIVNHPGAAGSLSATVASQAAPNGYTLYWPSSSLFRGLPRTPPNLPLMGPRDFAAAAMWFDRALASAASPEIRVKTVQGRVDRAI